MLSQKNYTFPELKIIFIDFAYHPLTKFINNFCIIFHSLILILHLLFVYKNFSAALVLRYGCFIALKAYVSCLKLC